MSLNIIHQRGSCCTLLRLVAHDKLLHAYLLLFVNQPVLHDLNHLAEVRQNGAPHKNSNLRGMGRGEGGGRGSMGEGVDGGVLFGTKYTPYLVSVIKDKKTTAARQRRDDILAISSRGRLEPISSCRRFENGAARSSQTSRKKHNTQCA